MSEELELRKHRCCFTGHRPQKLAKPEEEVKAWLRRQIEQAVADGYTTFITGMAMGVDIWAGQIVVEMRSTDSRLHLIAAVPWPGFAARWSSELWKDAYKELLAQADLVRYMQKQYTDDVFQKRNIWMVDHSSRLIAYYNGQAGGTANTIEYAENVGGLDVIIGGTEGEPVSGNAEI